MDQAGAPAGTVTTLLREAREGRRDALDRLFSMVYDDLRRLAQHRLGPRRPGDLEGTALVHEACARLLAGNRLDARDRAHFFAIFGLAMRDALVDHVRRESAKRRGGDLQRIELMDFEADGAPIRLDVLAAREALEALGAHDPDGARMVTLRIFAGRTLDEASELMGVTPAIGRRHWDYARAWLLDRIDRNTERDREFT